MDFRPFCVALLAVGPSPDATWSLLADERAHLQIHHSKGKALDVSIAGWAENWRWLPLAPRETTHLRWEAPENKDGISSSWSLNPSDPAELRVTWRITRPLTNVSGLGLRFQFADQALVQLSKGQRPDIAADQSGFSWKTHEGNFKVQSTPTPSQIYFERDGQQELRLMFLSGDIPEGNYEFLLTMDFPGQGTVTHPAPVAAEDGLQNTVHPTATPLDLSDLNKDHRPAGKHGRVETEGSDLVFGNGEPARFWGVNLAAYALFEQDKELIQLHASRIAALGFNLVRLHHHDSPWVRPNLLRDAPAGRMTQEEALDRFDWWVHCLRERGVYLWIDLHTERSFTPEEGIHGYSEIVAGGNRGAKGFCFINESIAEQMTSFAQEFLTHKNPYSKLPYAKDPAIFAVQIVNENDLTHHFGNLFLEDKNHPIHRNEFLGRALPWIKKNRLPREASLRTWEPGPSKILLAELEHQFFQQQLQGIRKAGYEGLVVPTSTWGGNGVASLPALAAFGSVDAHAYGSRGFLGSNPHQRPYFLHWLAAAQVQGLPHFASEWSVPQPAHDRAAAPLMVAAMARLQGWDAPILYNYSQRPLAQDSGGDTFSIAWDPAYIATLQAAALAYRREDVSPAHHSVRYHPQGGTWQNETPESSLALRSIAEQHQIEISLDEEPALNWWKPEKSSNSFEFKALDEGRVRSDTQEIERSWEQNQWSLFTPRTVAASGTLENGLRLHQFFFQSPLRHATIAWTSLDAQPIPTADQVLLSIVGNAVLEGNGQKIWSAERCPARVEIPRKQAPQSLHAVFPNGDPGPAIPHQWENGILKFNLDGNIATHWYLIRNS